MGINKHYIDMIVLDNNLEWFGLRILDIMEIAGRNIALAIEKKYGNGKCIGIFCGRGNNGGDGLVAARYLKKKNSVSVFLAGGSRFSTKEAEINWKRFKGKKVIIGKKIPDLKKYKFDIIVDGLLGMGIRGIPRNPVKGVILELNKLKAKKVAIDFPSGAGSSVTFKDNLTLSLHKRKKKGAKVLDIGIPKEMNFFIGPGQVKTLSKPKTGSHKGDNGVLTVIGGSKKYHGAPLLAIKSAERFVDMIYFHSPELSNLQIAKKIKSKSLHFATVGKKDLDKTIRRSDCILVGNGMGNNTKIQKLVNTLLKKHKGKRFILDADALKVVNKKLLRGNIITPHAKEFEILFGKIANRKSVKDMAKKYGCTIVLKGRVDLVSDGKNVYKNFSGNEEMTCGGTGDVLAGIIAALACTNSPLIAAQAGVFLNGLAGDILRDAQLKFSAEDLANSLITSYIIAMEF